MRPRYFLDSGVIFLCLIFLLRISRREECIVEMTVILADSIINIVDSIACQNNIKQTQQSLWVYAFPTRNQFNTKKIKAKLNTTEINTSKSQQ